jgi:hypothetical protein
MFSTFKIIIYENIIIAFGLSTHKHRYIQEHTNTQRVVFFRDYSKGSVRSSRRIESDIEYHSNDKYILYIKYTCKYYLDYFFTADEKIESIRLDYSWE